MQDISSLALLVYCFFSKYSQSSWQYADLTAVLLADPLASPCSTPLVNLAHVTR